MRGDSTTMSEKTINIQATVFNPKEPQLNKDIALLVDTGADTCVIPKKIADELKVEYLRGNALAQVADGRVIKAKMAYIGIQIEGEIIITLFSVIDSDVEPLLGFDIMELLDFTIEVRRRRVKKTFRSFKILKRNIIMRLKTEATRGEG